MQQSYYIFTSGELHRKDDSLILINSEGKKYIPIERVYDIYVFATLTINTTLLSFLSQKKISIHFYNYYDFYIGSYYPKETLVSGKLLINQVEKYQNYEERMFIAQQFIEAASYNILRNLKYYNNREKDLTSYIDEIEELRKQIYLTYDIKQLMGVEGNIRKLYYSAWPIIINQKIEFEKRVKRPPDNLINTLISFMNSIIYTKTLSEIYKTQLNPTISYLHEPSDKRFSLCLDVSEVFKPLIVDRTIFSLLNKNMITENDFYTDDGGYYRMKESSIKKVMKALEETLSRTIKHKDLNRDVSYKHLIRLELYKLIKHIINEKNYEGFKIWW
ncbi:MAG: type I-B CRISPR-associated endonuclease Cas1b [Longibaculum muris]|uniref:CRISPR-associated endonuclease Cas1 n=1 Tax=Longibaculum muris TaxID=1796628 RepID=A0A4R3Z8M7_9FIRM|nr:type I-B CRISPR-associated endonuclease Cas1b [Longibaculum muris]MBS5371580.1 type I-B CRISPR-associated endonuclease Cas1 [Coprobacillus cateniformis]MCR1886952.1 type I-B CRISPR-associated endonuclease Cas1b [Longibaculum muris]MED9811378.1 type I-B CRISPR-associated endonuclease Cas1b [Longibaculum muris]TCW02983.1 CRISPR-associated Cas1 family protein [Longibaculum muris]